MKQTQEAQSKKKYDVGIYPNMTDEEYFAIDAINNSFLNTIHDKSPAHAMHEKIHGSTSSAAMSVGSALHYGILQPELFKKKVHVLPNHAKNTNKFWDELILMFPEALSEKMKFDDAVALIQKQYAGHVLITQQQYDDTKKVIEAVLNDKTCKKIFADGQAETVLVWEEQGHLFKCKFDWLNFNIQLGVDLKKSRDASPEQFAKSIANYGYYRQLEFYMRGARALNLEIQNNALLVFEEAEPVSPVVYDISPEARQLAVQELEELIDLAIYCKENNDWHGYVDENKKNFFMLDLPAWQYSKKSRRFIPPQTQNKSEK